MRIRIAKRRLLSLFGEAAFVNGRPQLPQNWAEAAFLKRQWGQTIVCFIKAIASFRSLPGDIQLPYPFSDPACVFKLDEGKLCPPRDPAGAPGHLAIVAIELQTLARTQPLNVKPAAILIAKPAAQAIDD